MPELFDKSNGICQEITITIRSILTSFKHGCPINMLAKEYYENCGEQLPFRRFGYRNASEFLASMPDVARFGRNKVGDEVLFAVATVRTEHVAALVRRQKSAPVKASATRARVTVKPKCASKPKAYHRPQISRYQPQKLNYSASWNGSSDVRNFDVARVNKFYEQNLNGQCVNKAENVLPKPVVLPKAPIAAAAAPVAKHCDATDEIAHCTKLLAAAHLLPAGPASGQVSSGFSAGRPIITNTAASVNGGTLGQVSCGAFSVRSNVTSASVNGSRPKQWTNSNNGGPRSLFAFDSMPFVPPPPPRPPVPLFGPPPPVPVFSAPQPLSSKNYCGYNLDVNNLHSSTNRKPRDRSKSPPPIPAGLNPFGFSSAPSPVAETTNIHKSYSSFGEVPPKASSNNWTGKTQPQVKNYTSLLFAPIPKPFASPVVNSFVDESSAEKKYENSTNFDKTFSPVSSSSASIGASSLFDGASTTSSRIDTRSTTQKSSVKNGSSSSKKVEDVPAEGLKFKKIVPLALNKKHQDKKDDGKTADAAQRASLPTKSYNNFFESNSIYFNK